ncbi:BadF/BadG/BcrA/BcrD ATPase family protein [Nonomuraea africana]|uniref:N-acetylglucosamine kinase-like BadF-type ATPase n=1 Tax=Nonomuraea africana TaxID=46171 RepID=A0ABR9KII4_9ACTN|nr:BadF/BadG/BcrA/BcrD ATPase family protein [Nonomuraea africana]MBE1561841.1 N-acetylglucosamine kinase-like BadF-type ATPase [Nonomuraea africana]
MLFAGVDAGGTTTRVAVHDASGARAGYGTAGGGNPAAHGSVAAGAAVAAALRQALHGLDSARVTASVAGVAGAVDGFDAVLRRIWAEHGLRHSPRLVSDVDVAYAAGTRAPSGTLLLAGTGAAAARFADRALDGVADGLGWLLGDEGVGFWIGRAGVRAAVRAMDNGAPYGPLAELVSARFGASGPPRRRAEHIVRLAQADRMSLAATAPLVARAATMGDPLAGEIVRDAAGRLVAAAARLHRSGPIVLAGGILTSDGPVRQAVLGLLTGPGRLPALREVPCVVTARDGAGAASWLAALDHRGERRAGDAHPRFTDPETSPTPTP